MTAALDVSVIVPCYNTVDFIEECLLSAVWQKNVAAEVIVIDDKSTDGSLDKVRALAAEYPNIVIHECPENIGQSRARNIGIDMARGRYIALLDSDDYYEHDEVLRRWVDAAETFNADVCIGDYQTLTEGGDLEKMRRFDGHFGKVGSVQDIPELSNMRQSWEALFRTDFLKEAGVRFSEELRQREDRLFFTEALAQAGRVVAVDEPTLVYRFRGDSTMRKVDFNQMAMHATSIQLQIEALAHARSKGFDTSVMLRMTAISQWLMALAYWNHLLIFGLRHRDQNGSEWQTAKRYFDNIAELSEGQEPFYDETAYIAPRGQDERLFEGRVDMARLSLAAGRFDFLERILSNKGRLDYFEVQELVEASSLPWARRAGLYYLKFNRNYDEMSRGQGANTKETFAGLERIIVHIGQPKTGTSAIQDMLEDHRFDLAERGILYPITGCGREDGARRNRSAGHGRLIQNTLRGEHKLIDVLAQEIAGHGGKIKTLVISAENLLSHRWLEGEEFTKADPVGTFLRRSGLRGAEVVAAFRPRKAWMKSYYRELAANPFNDFQKSPGEFINWFLDLGLLDYDAIRTHLEGLKAVKKLHALDFEEIRKVGAERSFAQLIGVEDLLDDANGPRKVNESFSDGQSVALLFSKSLKISHFDRHDLMGVVQNSTALNQSGFNYFEKTDFSVIDELFGPEGTGHQRTHMARYDRHQESYGDMIRRAMTQTPEVAPPSHFLQAGAAEDRARDADHEHIRELQRHLREVYASRSWKMSEGLRRITTKTARLLGRR